MRSNTVIWCEGDDCLTSCLEVNIWLESMDSLVRQWLWSQPQYHGGVSAYQGHVVTAERQPRTAPPCTSLCVQARIHFLRSVTDWPTNIVHQLHTKGATWDTVGDTGIQQWTEVFFPPGVYLCGWLPGRKDDEQQHSRHNKHVGHKHFQRGGQLTGLLSANLSILHFDFD